MYSNNPHERWTSKLSYHLFQSVVSKCPRASKALNADDNLVDPQQTDTSLSQEAQQRVPAGEDCLCWGQNRSQTKRENIQLRWESLHSLVCEANKQGSDRNTSPLSGRFATWAQGCDQNGWSHNTSSNNDFYLRSFRANIKLGEIFLQNCTG